MILDIPNEFYISSDLGYGTSEDYNSFPTLEELLLDAGGIRMSGLVGLGRELKKEHLKLATKEDYSRVTSPKSRCSGNIGRYIGYLLVKPTLTAYK